jgi:hypothetical protein
MEALKQAVNAKLDKLFTGLQFQESDHSYTLNGESLESVTTYLGDFDFFDRSRFPQYKLDAWSEEGRIACLKGDLVHSFIEHALQGLEWSYPAEGYDEVREVFEASMPAIEKVLHWFTSGRVIFIAAEFTIFDVELGLAGTIDALVWNVKAGCLEIWDWKSNKKFTTSSNYPMKGVDYAHTLNGLSACKLDSYSLQVGLYKKILERAGIPTGTPRLIWVPMVGDPQVHTARCVEKQLARVFALAA